MTSIVGRTWLAPFWRLADGAWQRAVVAVAALELLVVGGTLAVEAGGRRSSDAAEYLLLAMAAGATSLARWSQLGALAIALIAALAYVGRGGSEHGPLVLAVMAALYAAVRPDRPWRSVVIGAATLLGFYGIGVIRSAADLHAAGVSSSADAHALGAASSTASDLVASFVNRSWIAVPLVLGHAVASSRTARAAAEERARLAEQTRDEHAQRRVAEERLRIARELHDAFSHTISVINLQAGVALHVMNQHPDEAHRALVSIKTTSRETLRELRGALGLLRQGEDPEPLEPAPTLDQLSSLVDTTTQSGVPTRLTVAGHARRLSPAVELTAYRIVQESLTNVLRHARAASAAVTLTYEDERLAIEVTDDGQGPEPGGDAGLGIVGMKERAAAIGGDLQAGPGTSGGFRVTALLPAPPRMS